MSRVLLVSDDRLLREEIHGTLAGEGHEIRCAPDGRCALSLLAEGPADLIIADWTTASREAVESLRRLRRERHGVKRLVVTEGGKPEAVIDALRGHVCDFLTKPFTAGELRAAVCNALDGCPAAGIEVVSAHHDWVELLAPGTLAAIPPLLKLLTQLDAGLPRELHEAISYAFREMFCNAVEYGCRLDPSKRVEVSYVRLKRAVVCRIKDPGGGFDPSRLRHAAISNPGHDPLRHASVREEKGLRPGGFGIMLTGRLVDELAYNERHNELMFVKYLS
jgi:DNA-binding NarL/FixJ family response regulator/anti-sigma regulatory factor (Ser/Thr protein kinase)